MSTQWSQAMSPEGTKGCLNSGIEFHHLYLQVIQLEFREV